MKDVEAMVHRLGGAVSFSGRYPEFAMRDGMCHVLFVAPRLNATGYYRMICPALELNRTDSHRAIVSHVLSHDFGKRTEQFTLVPGIDDALLAWAHFIVLPVIYRDTTKLLERIRTVNPEASIVFDMHTNVFEYPEDHPLRRKVKPDELEQLWINIAHADRIHCASDGLSRYIARGLEERCPANRPKVYHVPALLSELSYRHIQWLARNGEETVRIGLIGSKADAGEILSIREALYQIKRRYRDQVEIVLFGWDGRGKAGSRALDGLERTYQKSVAFRDYYTTLNALKLDLALLPMRDSEYNRTGSTFMPYLELSAFHIPVVASKGSIYEQAIQPEDTGLLAGDPLEWEAAIAYMIEHKSHRFEMGRQAFKQAWRNHSYLTHKNALPEVFSTYLSRLQDES